MLWYLSGWRWGSNLIFEYYTKARTFFGGVQTLNFNTFWGFHEKKMNLFQGDGGMKISIHFSASFKTKVQNRMFLGDHKISCFFREGLCLIFLFWGWGGKQ